MKAELQHAAFLSENLRVPHFVGNPPYLQMLQGAESSNQSKVQTIGSSQVTADTVVIAGGTGAILRTALRPDPGAYQLLFSRRPKLVALASNL